MAFVKITKIEDNSIRAILTNNKNEYSIPLRLTGNGMSHFAEDKNQQRSISINPTMINIIKNGNIVSGMMDIRLTEMFGKILLEGISTKDWHSPVVVDTADIKEFWTDTIKSNCSVWNVEV